MWIQFDSMQQFLLNFTTIKSNLVVFVVFGFLTQEMDLLLYRGDRFDYTVFVLFLQYVFIYVYQYYNWSIPAVSVDSFLCKGRALLPTSTCFVLAQLMFMNAKVGVDLQMFWAIAMMVPIMCYRPDSLMKAPFRHLRAPILILITASGIIATSDVIWTGYNPGAFTYGVLATSLWAIAIQRFCEDNKFNERDGTAQSEYIVIHTINAIFLCTVCMMLSEEFFLAMQFLVNTPFVNTICHDLLLYVSCGAVSTVCLFRAIDRRSSPVKIAVAFTIIVHAIKYSPTLPSMYLRVSMLRQCTAWLYRLGIIAWTVLPIGIELATPELSTKHVGLKSDRLD